MHTRRRNTLKLYQDEFVAVVNALVNIDNLTGYCDDPEAYNHVDADTMRNMIATTLTRCGIKVYDHVRITDATRDTLVYNGRRGEATPEIKFRGKDYSANAYVDTLLTTGEYVVLLDNVIDLRNE